MECCSPVPGWIWVLGVQRALQKSNCITGRNPPTLTKQPLHCPVTEQQLETWFSYHQQSLLREQVGSCHMLPSDSSDTERTVTEMYTHQSTLDRDAPIGPRGARTPQAGVRRLTAPVLFCVELCPLFFLSVNEPTTAV